MATQAEEAKLRRALRFAPVVERFRGPVPFGIAMAIAEHESELDEARVNPRSGAAGLWQVIAKYAGSYGMASPSQRADPVASTRGVLAVVARNARWLDAQSPGLAADDRAGLLYYMHGEGRGSLVRALKVLRERGYPIALTHVLAARKPWNGRDGFRTVARRWRDWEEAREDLLAGRRPWNAAILMLARGARLRRALAPAPAAGAPAHEVELESGVTDGIMVNGAPRPAPAGLSVRSFLGGTVHRFRGRARGSIPVTEFVVHESVTRSAADTVAVLRRRGLGVHVVGAPDGLLTQHGDLGRDVLAHAGAHNARSIGVEVVNPYYPRYVPRGAPWRRVIAAGWAHHGRYVVPTPEQAEALALLLEWVTSPESGLSVPRRWIGVANGRMAMARVAGAARAAPGIYAHTYFGHADGAWLVLYAYLRLELHLGPDQAYGEAIRLATTPRSFVLLPSRPGYQDAHELEWSAELGS